MRGNRDDQGCLFFTIDVESRIRRDHPLRAIKSLVDLILGELDDKFEASYSRVGRPSVPPERLLKALLLMALYSIRSERQLCERINTDLLFRWFLDMSPEEDAFVPTAISHNRERLEQNGLISAFFDAVLRRAIGNNLCSDEHFSVDGTLIESWASMKSVRAIDGSEDGDDEPSDGNRFKPRNAEVDFHGKKRTNSTHRSRTDPDARLFRKGKGKETKLSHMGHALVENRHGLVMNVCVTEASGRAESQAALKMLDDLQRRQSRQPTTLGADKGYDGGPFYRELESRGVEPHVAMIRTRGRNSKHVRRADLEDIAARDRMRARTETTGYRISQRCRKKSEECFSWLKTIAGLGRSRWPQRWKLKQQMELAAAGYNLLRIRKLTAA